MRIALKNFQSISKSSVELDGIVALVGTNSCGKSAHIRALRCLITNQGSHSFVKANTDGFTIGFQDERGDYVLRKNGQNDYYVNGTHMIKVGRSILTEVAPDCGFIFEKEDDKYILPQFIFQKETPFPFYLSPLRVYSQFARFFGVEELETVLKSINQDLTTEKANQKYLTGKVDLTTDQISKANASLAKLPPKAEVDNFIVTFQNTSIAYDKARDAKDQQAYLSVLKANIQQLTKAISETEVPTVEADRQLTMLDRASAIVAANREDRARLKEAVIQHRLALKQENALSARLPVLVSDVGAIELVIPQITEVRAQVSEYSTWKVTLEGVERSLAELDGEIVAAETELSKFTICVLCGAPVDKEGHYHVDGGK